MTTDRLPFFPVLLLRTRANDTSSQSNASAPSTQLSHLAEQWRQEKPPGRMMLSCPKPSSPWFV